MAGDVKPQPDITNVLRKYFEPWNPQVFKGSPSRFHRQAGTAYGNSDDNRARALLVAQLVGEKEAKKDAHGRSRKKRKRVGGSQKDMSVAAAKKKAGEQLSSMSPGEIEKLAAQRRSDVGQWSPFVRSGFSRFTEEQQSDMEQYAKKGETASQIAALVGLKREQVYNYLNYNDIDFVREKCMHVFTEEEQSDMEKYAKKGETASQIAKLVGLEHQQVYEYLRSNDMEHGLRHGNSGYAEPPCPVPPFLYVSGASRNNSTNGMYCREGDENGKPRYVHKDDSSMQEPGRKVYWTGTTWDVYNDGMDSPECEADTAIPPNDGYDIDKGADEIRISYLQNEV